MSLADESNRQSTAARLAREWSERLAGMVESAAGKRPQQAFQTPVRLPESAGMLWWEQRLKAPPGAAVWIGSTEESWRMLGPHSRDGYLEMLEQSFSGLGEDRGAVVAAPHGAAELAGVVLEFAGGERGEFCLAYSGAAAGEPAHMPQAATLDLLLDIELPVSISFGRTKLPFQEVLKLSTGSVVELNRSPGDPVELIINERVIARGEVVMVNGNYGVRIEELASRSERLQTANRRSADV